MTVVDSSVWVSRFMQDEVHHSLSLAWLTRHLLAQEAIELPASAIAEVAAAIARRTGSRQASHAAVDRILALPNLALFSVDEDLALLSAEVAGRIRIRGMDSIYVALAVKQRLPLVTWDREQLERARTLVEVRSPS